MTELIEALKNPRLYGDAVECVELIETHISWVLLAGPSAYKIKKPVDLGFLDFSTLEKRRHFCEEEVRLNRRLAPQLYRGVLPITGSPAAPRLGGPGEPFEYAVEMARFEERDRLDHVLDRGDLAPHEVDALAADIAAFHARSAPCPPGSPFGTPPRVRQAMLANLNSLQTLPLESSEASEIARHESWTRAQLAAHEGDLLARHAGGFVRECHGDLHLANMVRLAGRIVAFDCLEFDPNLRWIDVASELAFTTMDLSARGRPDLGWRLLDGYLSATGDYALLRVLAVYQHYRALVRATVARIRGRQEGQSDHQRRALFDESRRYLHEAAARMQPHRAALIVTFGLSGSGKTAVTTPLVESLGAVRLRSDVERKRLFGWAAGFRGSPDQIARLYSTEGGRATYARLGDLARAVAAAGYPAIIDAACLHRSARERFRRLAADLNVPFVLLAVSAPEEILRQRIAARMAEDRDASDATIEVLNEQLSSVQPLTAEESRAAVALDTTSPLDLHTTLRALTAVLNRASLPPG